MDKSEELKMPWQLWLCFGSRGSGYNFEEALAAITANPEQRSGLLWRRLFENYFSYSPIDFLKMEMTKFVATWNDGRFDGALYALWPAGYNWTHSFTQPGQDAYDLIWFEGQVCLLFLYFSVERLTLRFVIRRNHDPSVFFCLLSIFGTMLYLQLFETSPRRALIVMPFFILLSGCVLVQPGTPEKKMTCARETLQDR